MMSAVRFVLAHLRLILTIIVMIVTAIITSNLLKPDTGPGANVLSVTNLNTTRNFGYKQGDEVLAYNGLAFYSTNVVTGKRTVLYSGTKLPTIKSMYWMGTNGAVMMFDDKFYGTPVNGLLAEEGKKPDATTKQYTWYLNFKKGTLAQISDRSIEVSGPTLYDDANKMFYYTQNTQGSSDGEITRIYSFDVAKQATRLLLDNANVTDIRGITKCNASKSVCFISHKSSETSAQEVYAIAFDGGLRKKFDVGLGSAILPTGQPDYYISSNDAGNNSKDFTLHDTSQDKDISYNLGYTLDEDARMHFVSDTDFYVINNGVANGFQTGSIKKPGRALKQHEFKLNDKPYQGTIDGVQTSPGNKVSLVSNEDTRQYLFGIKPNTTMSSFAKKETAQLAVATCNKKTVTRNRYDEKTRTFQIRIIALYGFAKVIKDFSNCIAKDHADAIHGYYYNFVGVNSDDSVAAE